MRYRLSPDGDVSKQLRRLMRSLNEEVALALLRACRDPEQDVHEARKRCKEIRALLRLFKPQMGKEAFRPESRDRHGHLNRFPLCRLWAQGLSI
ncbi:MAG: hypothetical protein R3296_00545 [Oleiphilaceae bacterium]|nr:hypothetical protein [Oleiphilaceae bacterium]